MIRAIGRSDRQAGRQGRAGQGQRDGDRHTSVRILLGTNVFQLNDVSALHAAFEGTVAGDLLPLGLISIPHLFQSAREIE